MNSCKKIVLITLLTSIVGAYGGNLINEPARSISAGGSPLSLADEIVVIVYGPERTTVICRSELGRIGVDGQKRTLEYIIFQELVFQETLKYKVPIDESVIDKYIESICKQQGINLEGVKLIFKRSGWTYAEGRDQLRMLYAFNSMIDLKITSRLVIAENEVLKHFNEHPEYKTPAYQLERAVVPFALAATMQDLESLLKSGKTNFDWASPFWLKEDEIATNMQFIISMKPGDISKPRAVRNGFEIYRLVAKKPRRVIPLEKRYKEIVHELRAPKYEREIENYKRSLFDNASIVYVAKDIPEIKFEKFN